jgi:hypothetical protein
MTWVAWVALAGQPLLVDLFLLAPLVLAPLVLRSLLVEDVATSSAVRIAVWMQLPAALLGVLGFVIEPGPLAAGLTVPWLGLTLVTATRSALHVAQRRTLGPISAFSIDAALVFVLVGAGWWTLARLGVQPLGFSPTIVFLTAVHFHYAGFALPVLAGLGVRHLGTADAKLAAAGVVIGVPLVAIGITVSPALELAAAGITALAAALVGLVQIRYATIRSRQGVSGPERRAAALLVVSGLCAWTAMGLAAAYAIGEYVQRPWPNVAQMIPTHGALNALGFSLLGLWAWNLEHPDDPEAPPQPPTPHDHDEADPARDD